MEILETKLCVNVTCGRKPISEFPYTYKSKGWRRKECKSCWAKVTAERNRIVKAKKNPSRYLSCEDCCQTFSRNIAGRPPIGANPRKVATECPYCGSKELESFEEQMEEMA